MLRIGYTLPEALTVKLTVYDMSGRLIQRLAQETQAAGGHQVTWDASQLPAGIYYYRLQAGAIDQTGRTVLLR